MRIVLRIGGSVVASPVNTELISKYANLLRTLKRQGHEIAVIVGGGKLAREFIAIAKELGLEERIQDEIAISVSRLFAQLFLKKLDDISCDNVSLTLDEAAECLSQGKIMFMGGLRPGITTDAVAALVAEHVKADMMIKGTDQDGVFNKDPRKFDDAVKLDSISYDDLPKIFEKSQHKAGIHQIIDPAAVKVLMRKRVKLIVVNGFKTENILAAANDKEVGTKIR